VNQAIGQRCDTQALSPTVGPQGNKRPISHGATALAGFR
jgi:hypothetical protein